MGGLQRESKDAGHHMDIHVEIAAFKEEEEPAAARMEPEKQDSPPSSRASPPPSPVPAPVISEAIKLDGEGASSTNEDTQAFDEKLQKMRDSLAGKAASRAAKLVGWLVITSWPDKRAPSVATHLGKR